MKIKNSDRLAQILLLAIVFCWSPAQAFQFPTTTHGGASQISVYFSPNGGATTAFVRELHNAQKEVLVQAYSFTSAPIAQALVEAYKRGVKVIAVLDKSQRSERYTAATFLANAGIPVLIDDKHAIAHNKIVIIDRSVLITGSFNFTKAAEEKNAENMLVIHGNQALIDAYLQNFEAHKAHSVEYAR